MSRRNPVTGLFVLLLIGVIGLLIFQFVQTSLKADFKNGRPQMTVILKISTTEALHFWSMLNDGLMLAAKEYNADLEVIGPQNETAIEEQIALMAEAIEKQPDAIILAATDYNRLADSVEAAHKKGIPVFVIDSAVNSERTVSFIATDNFEAGKKAGRLVLNELNSGRINKIAIISPVQGSASLMERERGVKEVLTKSGKIEIIGTYYSDDSREKAYEIARALIQNEPDLAGIVTTNEPSAVAVGQAIKDLGAKGRVKLIGFDSSIDEVKFIEEGVMQGTVVQRPFNMGYLTVKVAVEYLTGKEVPAHIDTGSVVITKENMYQREYEQLLFPFVD